MNKIIYSKKISRLISFFISSFPSFSFLRFPFLLFCFCSCFLSFSLYASSFFLSLFALSPLVFDFAGNAGCSRPLVTPLACVHQTNVSTCTRVPSSSFRYVRILDLRAAIFIHVASILGGLF